MDAELRDAVERYALHELDGHDECEPDGCEVQRVRLAVANFIAYIDSAPKSRAWRLIGQQGREVRRLRVAMGLTPDGAA